MEEQNLSCMIESGYNSCGDEENNFDFMCLIHREGEEPEDCSQDFFDPQFWELMGEEEFWQQNGEYYDFYMFWEEYHNGDHHDDDEPFCPDGTEEVLNSETLDTFELDGFLAACQAINDESEEEMDCDAIKLVLHFEEMQCSSNGDVEFDCQTEFFDGQSSEADWGHCEDSHELKTIWEFTKDDARW
jgi:hypothetical protein